MNQRDERRPVVVGAGPLLYLAVLALMALLMAGLLVWAVWGLLAAPDPDATEAVRLLLT